jgi:hypothetical protein
MPTPAATGSQPSNSAQPVTRRIPNRTAPPACVPALGRSVERHRRRAQLTAEPRRLPNDRPKSTNQPQVYDFGLTASHFEGDHRVHCPPQAHGVTSPGIRRPAVARAMSPVPDATFPSHDQDQSYPPEAHTWTRILARSPPPRHGVSRETPLGPKEPTPLPGVEPNHACIRRCRPLRPLSPNPPPSPRLHQHHWPRAPAHGSNPYPGSAATVPSMRHPRVLPRSATAQYPTSVTLRPDQEPSGRGACLPQALTGIMRSVWRCVVSRETWSPFDSAHTA